MKLLAGTNGKDVWIAGNMYGPDITMSDREGNTDAKWVILWLSLQLTGLSWYVTKQAYELGFEKGRASVYKEFSDDGQAGTCFAHEGCEQKPQRKKK